MKGASFLSCIGSLSSLFYRTLVELNEREREFDRMLQRDGNKEADDGTMFAVVPCPFVLVCVLYLLSIV